MSSCIQVRSKLSNEAFFQACELETGASQIGWIVRSIWLRVTDLDAEAESQWSASPTTLRN